MQSNLCRAVVVPAYQSRGQAFRARMPEDVPRQPMMQYAGPDVDGTGLYYRCTNDVFMQYRGRVHVSAFQVLRAPSGAQHLWRTLTCALHLDCLNITSIGPHHTASRPPSMSYLTGLLAEKAVETRHL